LKADTLAGIFGTDQPNLDRPSTLWDTDHLYAHWASGGDVFVTFDKGILAKKARLAQLGTLVMTLFELLSDFQTDGETETLRGSPRVTPS
jgi:hypothetical protein